jgi:hypothetical protein
METIFSATNLEDDPADAFLTYVDTFCLLESLDIPSKYRVLITFW